MRSRHPSDPPPLETAPSRRQKQLILLGFLALATALRLAGRLRSGLWYDEIQTLIEYVRLPLGRLLTSFTTNNNHPLYSLAAKLSIAIFGESALSLRLPALLFGVASVGLFYLYAARVTRHREALLASALLATSYHHVWFSQNARGYTLLLFLVLAATWLFENLLEGRDRRSAWLYAVTMALAAYTHLSAIFVALAHGAAWLWTLRFPARGEAPRRVRGPLSALLGSAALTLLLYAPLLRGMLAYFTRPTADKATVYSPFWALATVARSFGLGLAIGLAALLGAALVLVCGALSYGRESPPRLLIFILPGALIALPMVAIGRGLYPRFFFFEAGFVLLLLARGLFVGVGLVARWAAATPRTGARGFAVASLLLLLAWMSILPRAYALPKQDFEGAQRWVEAHRLPGEPVLTVGLTIMPYSRYYESDFRPVGTVPELHAALAEAPAALVLTTLTEYLKSDAPALLEELGRRGREVARFRGSVGDGDVVVYRIAAEAPQP